MDPVSATSFIAVTLVSCVNVVSQLHDTREKYKDAEITIGELTAQTTLVRYALERIQRLFLENPRAIASKLQAQDHTLFRAFDTALVGVTAVLELIECELQKLNGAKRQHLLLWIGRSKVAWNDTVMVDMLNKMMSRLATFTFLFQCMQMESLAEMSKILQTNQHRFLQIATDTEIIRDTVYVPRSILNPTGTITGGFDDDASAVNDFERFDARVRSSLSDKDNLLKKRFRVSSGSLGGERVEKPDVKVKVEPEKICHHKSEDGL